MCACAVFVYVNVYVGVLSVCMRGYVCMYICGVCECACGMNPEVGEITRVS